MKKVLSAAVALLLCAVLGIFSIACGTDKDTEGKDKAKTIKIGTISPNTGTYATYGVDMVNAYKLAVSEINGKGGITINGEKYELELVLKDSQGDPSVTTTAFNSLVADEIELIIGAVFSSNTSAITGLANEEEVVLLTPTATADSITTEDDYVFRTCYADAFQGAIAAVYAQKLGKTEVGVLYCTGDTYSKGLYDSFKAACGKLGITVKAVQETSSIQTTEYTNQFTALKNTGLDFVYCPFYYTTVGPYIVEQARKAGYTGIIMGADGYDQTAESYPAGANKDYLNNVMFTNHYDPADKTEAVQKFVTSFKAKYKNTPSALAALAYDALYMMADAIGRAQSSDAAKVRDALADTSYVYKNYVTGTFSLDKTGTPKKGAAIIEYKNTDGKVVTSLKDSITKLPDSLK